jgi:integral membrane protein
MRRRSGRIDGVTLRTTVIAFRIVTVAEALSWLGLLAGMYVKHVAETSELGVQVFGPIHGGIFLVYVLLALLVGRVLRWSPGTLLVALAAAVPPLATVWFERRASRSGRLPAPEPATAA